MILTFDNLHNSCCVFIYKYSSLNNWFLVDNSIWLYVLTGIILEATAYHYNKSNLSQFYSANDNKRLHLLRLVWTESACALYWPSKLNKKIKMLFSWNITLQNHFDLVVESIYNWFCIDKDIGNYVFKEGLLRQYFLIKVGPLNPL